MGSAVMSETMGSKWKSRSARVWGTRARVLVTLWLSAQGGADR